MPRRDKTDEILTQLAVLNERQENMAKETELLPKILEKVNSHERTLYGRSGSNGLVSDVKLLKGAYYGLYGIISFIGGAFLFFKDEIISFFSDKQ